LHIVFDDFIITLISLQSIYPYVWVHVISKMETLLCIFYTCMCCSSTLNVERRFQFCSRDQSSSVYFTCLCQKKYIACSHSL
jgi:hypothetical protein